MGYGEDNKCCETEGRSSSASGYQEGETDDEAMGTIERSGVPGATGGGSSEVEGAAEASEKCGNKEEKREAVHVSLTCMSRSPATQLGNETLTVCSA